MQVLFKRLFVIYDRSRRAPPGVYAFVGGESVSVCVLVCPGSLQRLRMPNNYIISVYIIRTDRETERQRD